VLYGSGAYAGVINIMTKKDDEKSEAMLAASYGSFDTRAIEAYAAQHVKGAHMMAAAKATDSNGWDFPPLTWRTIPKISPPIISRKAGLSAPIIKILA